VEEVSNGAEMIQAVRRTEFDLLLTDIHLPRVRGLEALREVRQQGDLAAVVITAEHDQSLLRRALEEGVLAIVIKPVDGCQLRAALATAWALFQERRRLAEQNASLRQSLQNRKIIERAKGALMRRHRWSEAEAFRRLQRSSMNRRVKLVDLAQAILNGVEIELEEVELVGQR
jgi:response regulator NasT